MSTTTRFTLEVVPDECPPNPRTDWDNLGTMALFHGRYDLGDKDHDLYTEDFEGWKDMEKHIRREYDPAVVLPVFMYDHGLVRLATGPFSCPWDSGQVGFIFVSKAKVRKTWGVKRISKRLLQQVTEILESEVETYENYLNGDVWFYMVKDENGMIVDSCGGYFSEEDARKEGEMAVKYFERQHAA